MSACLKITVAAERAQNTSICHQEMCLNWTGDGCACAVLGVKPVVVEDGEDEPREYLWPDWWRDHDRMHDRGDCGRCEQEEGHADRWQDCSCLERTLTRIGSPAGAQLVWVCDTCSKVTKADAATVGAA